MLVVVGEVDIANAHLLGRVATAALHTTAAISLSLDMSAVTFIDAVGVAAVIDCRREAARRAIAFRIVNPSRAVHATLRASGAGALLENSIERTPWPARVPAAARRAPQWPPGSRRPPR